MTTEFKIMFVDECGDETCYFYDEKKLELWQRRRENVTKMPKKKRSKPVPFIRSRAWRELRERVLERDEHRCVLCGSDKNL